MPFRTRSSPSLAACCTPPLLHARASPRTAVQVATTAARPAPQQSRRRCMSTCTTAPVRHVGAAASAMTDTGGAPVFVVQAARHASAWLLVQVVLQIGQSRERCTAGRQRSVAKSHTNATQGTQPYARSHGMYESPTGRAQGAVSYDGVSGYRVEQRHQQRTLTQRRPKLCSMRCGTPRNHSCRGANVAKWRTTCNMHKPNDRRRATRSRSSCSLRASARSALRPYESVRPNRHPPAQSAPHSALVPIATPTWMSSAPDRKRVRRAAMPACDGSSVMTPPSTAASAATSSSLGCSICGGRS